jgi:hypothetical protein
MRGSSSTRIRIRVRFCLWVGRINRQRFEVLDRPLVFLGRFATIECTEILSFAGFGIDLRE